MQGPCMVVEAQIGDRRTPGHQGGFRPPSIRQFRGRLPQVDSLEKATVGPELRVDAGVARAVAQVATLVGQVRFDSGSAKRPVSLMLRR